MMLSLGETSKCSASASVRGLGLQTFACTQKELTDLLRLLSSGSDS